MPELIPIQALAIQALAIQALVVAAVPVVAQLYARRNVGSVL